jgi:MFS family permease
VQPRQRYSAVLRSPHVLRLLLLAAAARAGIGIIGLATVLVVRESSGSYATAGVVAAMWATGIGVFAPFAGRLLDRLGPRRVLMPLAIVHAAALILLVELAQADAPPVLLALTALIGGCAMPPIGSVLRSLWPELVDSELLTTAFALDSVTVEFVFVLGPLLVALTAALSDPRLALLVAAVTVFAGTLAFAAAGPVRLIEPKSGAHDSGGRLGALRARGVQTVALSIIPVGFCIGAAEVAFPAFGEAVSGDRALSGPLIALWSLGSLVAGLAYGAYGHRTSPATAYERGMLVLPLVTLPLALAGSFAAMVPLTLLAGIAIAPLLTAANQVIGEVAPRGALIEAYTWPTTALVIGVTSGNAASGAVIEAFDWRAAFVVAGAVGAAGVLVVAARRATLQPAGAPSSG